MIKKSYFSNTKLKVLSLAMGGVLALATPLGISYAQGGNHDRRDDNHRDWNERRNSDNRRDDNDRGRRQRGENRQENPQPAPSATCEERQAAVNNGVDSYRINAQTRLQKMSSYLANQQTFVSQSGLAVENYDALIQSATEAQATLTSAINGLANPTVDCTTAAEKDSKLVKEATQAARHASWKFTWTVSKLSWAIINS